jgi:hypothetical protein
VKDDFLTDDATSTDGGEEVTMLLQFFRYSEPWSSLE